MIANNQTAKVIQRGQDILQTTVDMAMVIIDHRKAQCRNLPFVLAVQFSNRNVELPADFIFKAFENRPFLLERLCSRNMNRNRKNAEMLSIIFNHLYMYILLSFYDPVCWVGKIDIRLLLKVFQDRLAKAILGGPALFRFRQITQGQLNAAVLDVHIHDGC